MGSGYWSTDVHDTAAYRRRTGQSAFHHSDSVMASNPRSSWQAHPDLDPRGVRMRESRDSAEQPTSLAIAVLFDVTGSMGLAPRTLQSRLPELFGLILRRGYAEHPQILFGAIGDATCDRVPLQVGRFESGNRMDTQLGNILLEGGGGGQKRESYELAMYFMARHTSLDCHEKRGRRGYLFIIGDEMPYPRVRPREVATVIGDRLLTSIPTGQVVAELEQKYNVYFILPGGTSYAGDQEVLRTWRGLLGERVLELGDLDAVCETIALTIGLDEDAVDLDEGLGHLRDVGADRAAETVGKALARYARTVERRPRGTAAATASELLGLPDPDTPGTARR